MMRFVFVALLAVLGLTPAAAQQPAASAAKPAAKTPAKPAAKAPAKAEAPAKAPAKGEDEVRPKDGLPVPEAYKAESPGKSSKKLKKGIYSFIRCTPIKSKNTTNWL